MGRGERRPRAAQPGQDHRFASYVRLIESHLTADVPDAALRDRLAAVADQRLEQRHGYAWATRGADELLGPELIAVARRSRRAG